ncbi:MAG: hypothetical protein P8L74_04100 [Gammaproteobacteria bacterium]|nr:hypothetical protein [Gammaproteobacteria bacterium]
MTSQERLFLEACVNNDVDYINANVKSLKNKSFADEENVSPMLACMLNNSFDVANILIENGFDIDFDGKDTAPITMAIVSNSAEALNYLIKKGVDLNLPIENDYMTRPIAFSINQGLKDMTQILIDNGVDLSCNSIIHITDIENCTDEWPMISIASQSNDLDLFELVMKNSDVNSKSKLGLLPFFCLMSKSSDQNHSFQNKAARMLIENGAKLEPNTENSSQGISSSAITVMFAKDMSKKDRVMREKLILDIFKKELADPFYVDIDGCNLIQHAARMGSLKIIKKLLKLGVEPCKKNKNGRTSLHEASLIKDQDISQKIITELLKYLCDLDVRNEEGFTATEYAFNLINYDSAIKLIEEGARIPKSAVIKQNDQTLPLWVQLVCHLRYQNDVDRLTKLIKKGLNLNSVNYRGRRKGLFRKKYQVNILGVVLSRVILQSSLKINKKWGGYLDEDNNMHHILDFKELINLLLERHNLKPFPDMQIDKSQYKIDKLISLIQAENLLHITT